MQKRTIIATIVAAAAIAVSGTTGAVAGSLVTSKDIKDGTIVSADVADGKIYKRDLSSAINEQLAAKATNGKDGKDGVANVTTGAGYNNTWEAHSGLQTIVNKC